LILHYLVLLFIKPIYNLYIIVYWDYEDVQSWTKVKRISNKSYCGKIFSRNHQSYMSTH